MPFSLERISATEKTSGHSLANSNVVLHESFDSVPIYVSNYGNSPPLPRLMKTNCYDDRVVCFLALELSNFYELYSKLPEEELAGRKKRILKVLQDAESRNYVNRVPYLSKPPPSAALQCELPGHKSIYGVVAGLADKLSEEDAVLRVALTALAFREVDLAVEIIASADVGDILLTSEFCGYLSAWNDCFLTAPRPFPPTNRVGAVHSLLGRNFQHRLGASKSI
ncbi:hypothetical protein QR680_016969 [Steinernema hermaphroditum]|uniref:Uncharacterized protein n=1 Tax=Steinernema hermaphroditum TaxID=289476 RepID=A0AA39LNF0_9BILA|nr:hypothetical protein QR680_016969 [Steinernema hermaphroditum]